VRALQVVVLLGAALQAQPVAEPPTLLPAVATTQLATSLAVASAQRRHVWRDTPPLEGDYVRAYIEIGLGDRRKWEFDMRANRRAIDRIMPDSLGGYPVNYGFVPQTVSYDGDPFDVLVLGPPIEGGSIVSGVIVGLMHMEDEKGLDSKVVISRVDARGQPLHALTAEDRERIGGYFRVYKTHEADKFSAVPGWGSVAEGRAFVDVTHRFFKECRGKSGLPCRL